MPETAEKPLVAVTISCSKSAKSTLKAIAKKDERPLSNFINKTMPDFLDWVEAKLDAEKA